MNKQRLFQSLRDAAKGIMYVFKNEQNFRLQLAAGALVLFLAWFFPVSKGELIVLVLLIFLVLILELLNSAVEKLADIFKPRLSLQIEIIKDIMAAMVLLSSLASLIIGLIIFWPYLIALLTK